MIFITIVILIIFQRLLEMRHGKKNLTELEHELLTPVPQDEKLQMLVLHSSFFVALFLEFYAYGRPASPEFFLAGLGILLWAQWVRYRTMKLLGAFWTTAPVSFKKQTLVSSGPYRYLRHPNYLVVMVEILVIPLLGNCYMTATFFSLINLVFLLRRVKMEEEALSLATNYQEEFSMKKRLIPFLYSFLILLHVEAGELKLESKNFDQAKKAESFFKFTGESTKLGLVTTEFEGYARKAIVTFTENQNKIKDVTLQIEAKSLDTDNSARNEKMWEQSLSVEKYPIIQVTIQEIDLSLPEQTVQGVLTVRGKQTPITILVSKSERTFSGKSSFKLKDAGIPDPSIMIASVKDEFRIDFRLAWP